MFVGSDTGVTGKFPPISEFMGMQAEAASCIGCLAASVDEGVPKATRGNWTLEEDEALMKIIHTQDKTRINWEFVAAHVVAHTPRQCRERYMIKINPQVRWSHFSQWEDDVIRSERYRIGNHWSWIAQLLPGRTSCSVKNRWYTVLRHQNVGQLMRKQFSK